MQRTFIIDAVSLVLAKLAIATEPLIAFLFRAKLGVLAAVRMPAARLEVNRIDNCEGNDEDDDEQVRTMHTNRMMMDVRRKEADSVHDGGYCRES